MRYSVIFTLVTTAIAVPITESGLGKGQDGGPIQGTGMAPHISENSGDISKPHYEQGNFRDVLDDWWAMFRDDKIDDKWGGHGDRHPINVFGNPVTDLTRRDVVHKRATMKAPSMEPQENANFCTDLATECNDDIDGCISDSKVCCRTSTSADYVCSLTSRQLEEYMTKMSPTGNANTPAPLPNRPQTPAQPQSPSQSQQDANFCTDLATDCTSDVDMCVSSSKICCRSSAPTDYICSLTSRQLEQYFNKMSPSGSGTTTPAPSGNQPPYTPDPKQYPCTNIFLDCGGLDTDNAPACLKVADECCSDSSITGLDPICVAPGGELGSLTDVLPIKKRNAGITNARRLKRNVKTDDSLSKRWGPWDTIYIFLRDWHREDAIREGYNNYEETEDT